MGAPVGEGVAEIHIARPLMATLAIPRPTLQRQTPTYRNFEIVRIIGRQGRVFQKRVLEVFSQVFSGHGVTHEKIYSFHPQQISQPEYKPTMALNATVMLLGLFCCLPYISNGIAYEVSRRDRCVTDTAWFCFICDIQSDTDGQSVE